MAWKDPLGKRVSCADLVQEALQKPVKSVTHKSIARLWSGYGSIQEVAAITDDGEQHRLVVKQVCAARSAYQAVVMPPSTAQLPIINMHPHRR